MSLTIPDDLLAAAHISDEEAFQELLRKRNILLYRPTIEDFGQDLATLRKLGEL